MKGGGSSLSLGLPPSLDGRGVNRESALAGFEPEIALDCPSVTIHPRRISLLWHPVWRPSSEVERSAPAHEGLSPLSYSTLAPPPPQDMDLHGPSFFALQTVFHNDSVVKPDMYTAAADNEICSLCTELSSFWSYTIIMLKLLLRGPSLPFTHLLPHTITMNV